jgi:hypothetical protein
MVPCTYSGIPPCFFSLSKKDTFLLNGKKTFKLACPPAKKW